MKKHIIALAILFLVFGALPVSASEPYTNYTYDFEGKSQAEPQAYVPSKTITGQSLGIGELKSPSDVFVDRDGNIYIVDAGNNRIVILNRDITVKAIVSKFDNNGAEDTFNNPQGIFVSEKGEIYLADTDNGRIVVLENDYTLKKIVGEPRSALITNKFSYRPIRLTIDNAGRMYIVSLNTNQGIIQLDANGEFISFFGAVPVTPSFAQLLRRMIPIKSLKEGISLSIPTEYSSVAIDKAGFVIGTVGIIDPENFSPNLFIHRLNPGGADVLRRNGVHPPMGDVQLQEDRSTGAKLTSYLVDVAVRENGIYAVLDKRMGRVFTYSFDGELMYVFGGIGSGNGQFSMPVALDVIDGDQYIVVDAVYNQLLVFTPTEYAKSITGAIEKFYQRRYDEASEEWLKALKFTAKSEMVYNGVAKSEYKAQNYKSAMEYYKLAQNRAGYSKAFKKYRDGIVEKNFTLIFVVAVLVTVSCVALFIYLKRKKKKTVCRSKSRAAQMAGYAFYVMRHPFKGFWDLKHEKKGNIFSASVIVLLLVVVMIIRRQLTGFLVNFNNTNEMNMVVQFSFVILPFILWCISNWAITTLIDGEGSFKDIYITTAYALTPLVLINIPLVVLSNVFVLEEMSFYYLFDSISIIWSACLILIGIKTIHQFTALKTIVSIIIAVVGMAILVAIVLLLISLVQQLFNFTGILVKEIQMRN